MNGIKKVLGNRYARLVLGVILLVVIAAAAVSVQRARREWRRRAAEAAQAAARQSQERNYVQPEISPAEACEKVRRGEAVLLDVRDAARRDSSGGVEGAVDIPLAELSRRRAELPKGALIIVFAYTRVPAEVEAARVAADVLAGDYDTAILSGQAADWLGAGLRLRQPRGAGHPPADKGATDPSATTHETRPQRS